MRFLSVYEEKIINLYRSKAINTIADLSIETLAHAFNIEVKYHQYKSTCYYDDNCALMLLLDDQSLENKRADFFHELAHVIAHVGDQRKMSKDFVRLQERQAHWISLYASMPRYIFEPYLNDSTTFRELVELFQLPETMIRERIRIVHQQQNTESYYENIKLQEASRLNRSLQKGKIYDSTFEVLEKLRNQVGEDKLSYEIQSLLQ